jgi:hypothetical protein
MRQLARSSSSLDGQLKFKLLTLALNDRFLLDQPELLLGVPSSSSDPGDERSD